MAIERGTIQIVVSDRVVRSRRSRDVLAKFFLKLAARLTRSKLIKEDHSEYPTITDLDQPVEKSS